MNKTFLICLIFIFQTQVMAQQASTADASVEVTQDGSEKLKKPLGRVKSTTGVNSESSSFIGDPDNIDPLNANRENLKEDDEPVLEDIRQIAEAPPKEKIEDKLKATPKDADVPTAVTETPTEAKVSEQEVKALTAENISLKSDDPDLILEKKFNRIYRRYNINPTSDDVWVAATSKQTLREYVVQKGDTLWSISKILFGDSNFWPKIWALNNGGIHNPHFIVPNSKIYFHMGDEETAPTLSVGAPGVKPESSEPDISKIEKTEQDKFAGQIPDSLPLHRNERYFLGPKKGEIKIELGISPRFDYEASNDIYITDNPIKTDVQIQISETTKFRCYEGRIIKNIRYVGKLVEDYDVFEPLSSFKTDAGTMYAYRVYGKARPYQRRNLKLYDCKGLLTTDLIIIPKEKIQVLRNKQTSPSKKAVLIGGPEVVDQKVFAPNQVAYVDFGAYVYERGQEYNIMSQLTDEINGHIKIIEKYGSFAVVMITEVMDTVAIGDNVILN